MRFMPDVCLTYDYRQENFSGRTEEKSTLNLKNEKRVKVTHEIITKSEVKTCIIVLKRQLYPLKRCTYDSIETFQNIRQRNAGGIVF